jgi:hypothetical protein
VHNGLSGLTLGQAPTLVHDVKITPSGLFLHHALVWRLDPLHQGWGVVLLDDHRFMAVVSHQWSILTSGRFTLWPSVEKTKDSSNVIGGEQKFVHLAFTLKANSQRTMASKMPTW